MHYNCLFPDRRVFHRKDRTLQRSPRPLHRWDDHPPRPAARATPSFATRADVFRTPPLPIRIHDRHAAGLQSERSGVQQRVLEQNFWIQREASDNRSECKRSWTGMCSFWRRMNLFWIRLAGRSSPPGSCGCRYPIYRSPGFYTPGPGEPTEFDCGALTRWFSKLVYLLVVY